MSSVFAFALLVCAACAVLVHRYRRLLRYVRSFLQMQLSLRWFLWGNRRTTADLFSARASRTPSATALVFEGRSWSYAALERASNRVAAWALSDELAHALQQHQQLQGEGSGGALRPRQVVALMMSNRADFIILWLGLAKVGVAIALINTNLKGSSLAHCVRSCGARMIIVGAECAEALAGVCGELSDLPVFVHTEETLPSQRSSAAVTSLSPTVLTALVGPHANPHQPSRDLSDTLSTFPDNGTADYAALRQRACLGPTDLLFCIFTSGTTGLPKAARIKHLRFAMIPASFCAFFDLRSDDRIYCCLPLYHSAGGMIGVAVSWNLGATLVLARKFSARNFFADCERERCTVIQYIGQLCSYLLSTPPSPSTDRAHRVRVALGNGLSSEVFRAFQSRFGVRDIAEFYASTEGNANLVNAWNMPGVIGWIPAVAKLVYPLRVLRFDPVAETPVRGGPDGRCIEAGVGEVGELVARIGNDPLRAFDGYTDARATNAKILSGVFRQGDRWFRSGDLVRIDREGFVYFVDRVGDTFRWKGENVATTEVAAVLQAFQPATAAGAGQSLQSETSPTVLLREANVYGVSVPGHEGRAGMAALVLGQEGDSEPGSGAAEERLSNGHQHHQQLVSPSSSSSSSSPAVLASRFDFSGLWSHCASQLPLYAVPLFLRVQASLDTTGTFKQRKVDLQAEGFDPVLIVHERHEVVLLRDDVRRTFVPLDKETYARIQAGQVRL
jgi:fatty-acyl-CoA synthase